MASKQFLANVKRFNVSGEDMDPEILLVLAIPLRDVNDLAFLGAVKKAGAAVVDIQSAQHEMTLET